MENEGNAGATLRDELTAAYDAAEAGNLPPTQDAPPIETPPPAGATPAPAETAQQKEERLGRTAGRPRDEKGRLLPGKPIKDAAPQAQTPEGGPPPTTAQPAPAAAAPVPRPSSWKKDHWDAFDKLAQENPALAQYINQREQEFARGVGTYRQEWEQAKPVLDAIAPFMPQLKQHGIDPAQWVSNLGNAHARLVASSPQDKLALFQKLAADYQIPAQLAVQGADGQWQLLGQLPTPQQQPAHQPQPQQLETVVQQVLQQERMKSEVEQFWNNKEKYPYAEQVRETMAGLLQAELANDLNDAYEQALLLPRHADLLQAQRDAQQAKDEAERQAKEAARVNTARAKAISPRTSTPSAAAGTGKKDLRAELSEQYDAHVGGRV